MWKESIKFNANKGAAIGLGGHGERYLRNSYVYPYLKWIGHLYLGKSQPHRKTLAIFQGISSPLENHKYLKVKHLTVFSLCLIVGVVLYISEYFPKHQFRCGLIVAKKSVIIMTYIIALHWFRHLPTWYIIKTL